MSFVIKNNEFQNYTCFFVDHKSTFCDFCRRVFDLHINNTKILEKNDIFSITQQQSKIKNFFKFEIHEIHFVNANVFFSNRSNFFFFTSHEMNKKVLIQVIFKIFVNVFVINFEILICFFDFLRDAIQVEIFRQNCMTKFFTFLQLRDRFI